VSGLVFDGCDSACLLYNQGCRSGQDYCIGTVRKMSVDVDATPRSVVACSAEVVHRAVPIR